jgi:tetratricopeptide (TPR) repeat protein
MFRTTLLGHFQPLAWMSLSLDKALWGLNPGGFHLTALVLHAASAVLLFVFLRGLLGSGRDASAPAAAAAALFAWHPLRVESVAWAVERRDGLMLFFLLAAAELYRRAVARDARRPDLGPAAALFAAAALSKVFAAVFPGLLLLLDLCVFRRPVPVRRLIAEKAAFWLVAAACLALGVRAQSLAGISQPLSVSGWGDRLALALWTPGWTAWKTVLPTGLTPFVYVDWRGDPRRFGPVAALTVGLLAALAFAAATRRRAWLGLGAAWLLALSPALGLFRSGPQCSADRFSLLPSVVLAVGAAFLLKRLGRRACFAALALALVLGAAARAQTAVWRDSVSLWTRAAEAGPENPLELGNLAAALREAGREDEAAALYARLSALAPGEASSLAVAGDARFRAGDWEGAADLYARALARRPELSSVRVDRGLALYRLGRIPEAADEFAEAARAAPDSADAWHDLGIALARLGRLADADRALVRALELDPSRRDSRRARDQLAPLLRRAR